MMAGKIARKYFLGQGVGRLGCAQSVAESLRERYGLNDAFIKSMSGATGGRAPLGCCGAVYAALRVVEEKGLHKKQEIEAFFKKEAGGIICREIRSRGQLMCADCVEQAANLLSDKSNEKGAL
ncbi:MAG: C_GCAxxG_C_C family protein [Candidatus Omnitrophica bacterium]|nr:C_GCAxxG_C_C family protein [Candidatus Omnitrophota bacterium]